MELDKTQTFDKLDVLREQERIENPFGLTDLEERVVRRSLPAFLKSAVKYSDDLQYSAVDYRHYLSCFKVPYNREREQDSYLWRMYHYIANFDTSVFTRSCGARAEMSDLLHEMGDYIPTEQFNNAIIGVSSTFEALIEDFLSSRINVKCKILDGRFVNGLISADKLPEVSKDIHLNENETIYCAEIIRDAMEETQKAKTELARDFKNEQEGM